MSIDWYNETEVEILMSADKEDIIKWIIEHRSETETVDEINSVTFPFTSKYKKFTEGYGKEIKA